MARLSTRRWCGAAAAVFLAVGLMVGWVEAAEKKYHVTGRLVLSPPLSEVPSLWFLKISVQDVSRMDAPSKLLAQAVWTSENCSEIPEVYTVNVHDLEAHQSRSLVTVSGVLNLGWTPSGNEWLRVNDYLSSVSHSIPEVPNGGKAVKDLMLEKYEVKGPHRNLGSDDSSALEPPQAMGGEEDSPESPDSPEEGDQEAEPTAAENEAAAEEGDVGDGDIPQGGALEVAAESSRGDQEAHHPPPAPQAPPGPLPPRGEDVAEQRAPLAADDDDEKQQQGGDEKDGGNLRSPGSLHQSKLDTKGGKSASSRVECSLGLLVFFLVLSLPRL